MTRAFSSISQHGTCVALDGRGVLLLGAPGSGKSDLALRLLETGAELVADDQVELEAKGEQLWASAPVSIAGKIEMRGIGIVQMPFVSPVPLRLAVELTPREKMERLPETIRSFDCLNHSIPLVLLHAFDASTVFKIRHLVSRLA